MADFEDFLMSLSPEKVVEINGELSLGFISQATLQNVETLVDAIAASQPVTNLTLYRGFEEYDDILSIAPVFLFKSLEKEVALDYADPYLAEIHYPQPVLGINMDPYWYDPEHEYEGGGFFHKREYVFLTLPFESFVIEDEYTVNDSISNKEVLVVDSLPYPPLAEIKRRYRSFYQPDKAAVFDKIIRRAEHARRSRGWVTIIRGQQIGDANTPDRGNLRLELIREFGHPSEPLPVVTVNSAKGQYMIK